MQAVEESPTKQEDTVRRVHRTTHPPTPTQQALSLGKGAPPAYEDEEQPASQNDDPSMIGGP